ncbi:MAG TPA: hypothetical protein VF444_22410 [Pseudonocardiaceae bacterium]
MPAEVRTPAGRLDTAPELPAAVEELSVHAATRLGWHGTVLPQMSLLGRRIVVVADVLTEAHAERICLGYEPVPDRATVSTWVWPELAGKVPPAAARIQGVMAVARHWRTALASVVPFARYAETAIVLPWWAASTHDYLVHCLPRARRYGVSVLTADPEAVTDIDAPATAEPPATELDATGRWLNEAVYEKLITVGAA